MGPAILSCLPKWAGACIYWQLRVAGFTVEVAREPRMTKEQVETALIEMERLREASRLADDVDEQRQFANDYHRLWRKVRPYVEGAIPYAESK
jgi:hypothetical protein